MKAIQSIKSRLIDISRIQSAFKSKIVVLDFSAFVPSSFLLPSIILELIKLDGEVSATCGENCTKSTMNYSKNSLCCKFNKMPASLHQWMPVSSVVGQRKKQSGGCFVERVENISLRQIVRKE